MFYHGPLDKAVNEYNGVVAALEAGADTGVPTNAPEPIGSDTLLAPVDTAPVGDAPQAQGDDPHVSADPGPIQPGTVECHEGEACAVSIAAQYELGWHAVKSTTTRRHHTAAFIDAGESPRETTVKPPSRRGVSIAFLDGMAAFADCVTLMTLDVQAEFGVPDKLHRVDWCGPLVPYHRVPTPPDEEEPEMVASAPLTGDRRTGSATPDEKETVAGVVDLVTKHVYSSKLAAVLVNHARAQFGRRRNTEATARIVDQYMRKTLRKLGCDGGSIDRHVTFACLAFFSNLHYDVLADSLVAQGLAPPRVVEQG